MFTILQCIEFVFSSRDRRSVVLRDIKMEVVPTFESMPNFRPVVVKVTPDTSSTEKHCQATLYRSSRPDFLENDELKKFEELGIKCIIDLRSSKEYEKANGAKNLNKTFTVNKISLPLPWKKLKVGEKAELKPIEKYLPENTERKGKHVLVNFFRLNYIVAVFSRAPWYLQIMSLFYLLIDLIGNTGYKNFVRIFARNILNPVGIAGQYKDMVTYSHASICSALKLLTEKENIPAMLNCAHGKDRTGIIVALVMHIVRKPQNEIFQEYAKSSEGLQAMKDRLYKEIVVNLHMCPSFTTAKESTMEELFKFLTDEYGSVDNYLEFIGFSQSEQAMLRENLLGSS
ncbi:unnamed protein product [Dimorphilus gyrociliatus]|uniref:Uncharacterized protein n=1 Tax=Dimorphilus gyrociliatus TaxID=2664684 RepID=A0A7I8VLR7_9ANNE|nr:unnamed protein product [Dimorphilus gyrociliatus]